MSSQKLPLWYVIALLLAPTFLVFLIYFAFVARKSVATNTKTATPTPAETLVRRTTSARVIGVRIATENNAIGKPMRFAKVKWTNTGTTPIRVVDCDFKFLDGAGNTIQTLKYTAYATFDSHSGILPEQTYEPPLGEGFVVIDPSVVSIQASATSVREFSGM